MSVIKKEHLGKRLLITDGYTLVSRDEVLVIELSPSGKNVKLKSIERGNSWWENNDEWTVRIVEILP